MIFGLAGSARTGKTTLAKQIAKTMGFHYHDAGISKFAKEFNTNAVGDLPLAQRIELQEFILKRYVEELLKAPQPLITDRTPLDMIGYMLGEVTMHNTPIEFQNRIDDYAEECINQATRHFQKVIIIRPLPHYEVDPLKPPPNRAYQSMVQLIIEGASQAAMYLYTATVFTTDAKERLDWSCGVISKFLSNLELSRVGKTAH